MPPMIPRNSRMNSGEIRKNRANRRPDFQVQARRRARASAFL